MSQQREYSLTINDFGARIHKCRASVYNMIKRGEIRAVKIGGSSRILMSDIEVWERNLKTVGSRDHAQ